MQRDLLRALALKALPVAQFPDIVPPQVEVTAFYPGAGAEVVEQTVAQPIEAQVVGVDNMLYMKSTSGNDGSYTLTVTFAVGTDPDINTVNVQNRVSLAEPKLPEEVRRQGLKISKKSSAILQIISVYSPDKTYDSLFLSNYVTINMLDSIKRIRGVGDAFLFAGLDYSMRVWLTTDRLTSLGLTPNDVINAIKGQNLQAAVGRIGAQPMSADQTFQLNIQTQGRLVDPEAFERIVVRANPDGSFVRIGDIGRVELGAQSSDAQGRFNGGPGAVIAVFLSPGANAVSVASAVGNYLADAAERFPKGVAYKVTYDSTDFVRESIIEVQHTLFEAFVLVAIVVFLFLGNLRATLIPIIAVPVSLIGTFAVMLALGFSANMVSLLALVVAIGIVVDDAIVVVENVERVMEQHPELSPSQAAKQAMGEITAPILAITLVLLSVFVPVAFIPGISGQMFQQFAVAVSASMVISALNALTLSPALCAVFLRPRHGPRKGLMRYVLGTIDLARDRYAAATKVLVRRAALSVNVLAVVFVGVGYLFETTPTGFVPEEDQGAFFVEAQLAEGSSVNYTATVVARIEQVLMQTPGVASVTGVIGYSWLDALKKSNSAFFAVRLKPFEERPGPELDVHAILARLHATFLTFPDANVFVFNIPPI
nr:efflux RND transporter permease subunit [Gammaproteobacteria bacterium]